MTSPRLSECFVLAATVAATYGIVANAYASYKNQPTTEIDVAVNIRNPNSGLIMAGVCMTFAVTTAGAEALFSFLFSPAK